MEDMSVLRKRGKEKLRIRKMSKLVTNKQFKYVKKLILECLKENPEIEQKLDSFYRYIQVFIFHSWQEKNVIEPIETFLQEKQTHLKSESIPALAISSRGRGCIPVFLKHLDEYTKKRTDITNVESYHKNGFFEELCHLVEHKGSSFVQPKSYNELWQRYFSLNMTVAGNEILVNLDTNRNHYEVYLMMIDAYPNDWVKRYWKFYSTTTPIDYNKMINVPKQIVKARIITDTLKTIGMKYVIQKIPEERLLENSKKLSQSLMKFNQQLLNQQMQLLETEMDFGTVTLIEALSEDVFETPAKFFAVILDLWKTLKLI